MKAREILKKENTKMKEQRAVKKEALKAKRMLGEDAEDDGDHNHRGIDGRQNVTATESESDNEGFSSEDESFKSTNFSVDKKMGMNTSENSNTFLTSTDIPNTSVLEKKVDENGNPYELATVGEKARLEALLKREATHWQFDKHAVCFLLLVSNVLVSLMRGSKKSGSIIGTKPCDAVGWVLVGVFIMICSACTYFGVRKVNNEQKLKKKVGKGIAKSDVKFEGSVVYKLVIFALLGGWVSGALGLGGGAIFNPLLLSMGVPPAVASSTGMYMIMFSTAGSSITYIVFGTLNIQFGFWIGSWCAVASIIGLYILNKVVKKFNRQSPIVFLLTFVLGLSAVLVPVFAIVSLQGKAWSDILSFKSIC